MALVPALLAVLLPITAAQIYPVFDGRLHVHVAATLAVSHSRDGHSDCCSVPTGKLRETSNEFYEAYLIPPAVTNHASFIHEMPNGDFVLAWFAGTAEGADNCSIVMAFLPKGSDQWSEAKLVSRRPGYSNQNPVLFLDPTGQVWCEPQYDTIPHSLPPFPLYTLRCCTSSTPSSQLAPPLLRPRLMCGCYSHLMKVSVGQRLVTYSLRMARSTEIESYTLSLETGSSPSTMLVYYIRSLPHQLLVCCGES